MAAQFDSFVIFAEMRTGSNLLESCLNQLNGLQCHGEVFNPRRLADPKTGPLLALTQTEIGNRPQRLLKRMKKAPGLHGFRYFHDHDPRILDEILNDSKCAKIILTRNPVESYISLKIAYNTDRWQLSHIRDSRPFQAPFKPAEFEAFLGPLRAFQALILNSLQRSGQTAFYLDYTDITDLTVLNGLAAFLGCADRIDALPTAQIVQNPHEMAEKVRNFPEMEAALAKIDWANLSRTPNFEPRRGPHVPGFIGSYAAGLLFMPIQAHPTAPIRDWLGTLARHDNDTPDTQSDFTRKTLREWMQTSKTHRSFTVLRHPLVRAHAAFCSVVALPQNDGLRQMLAQNYDVPNPADPSILASDLAAFHAGFLGFLGFLRANLNQQTGFPVLIEWASQTMQLKGFGEITLPHVLCREDRLAQDLTELAAAIGAKGAEAPTCLSGPPSPIALQDIYDGALEQAARRAYGTDYLTLGFDDWRPTGTVQ
ncbi:MAG: nodulation protein NodH [Paracoccaceae bacterium]|nr:nodulation protein NodH [Paracoccaceae bacterium]